MWDRFTQHIRQILPEHAEEILQAINIPQYPAIRFNLSKNSNTSFTGQTGGQTGIIPWEKNAMQLKEYPSFISDPHWHGGAYYVQESSSMFLGKVISMALSRMRYYGSLKVLDLCAAPGGKSTHLLDVLPDDALLVSNEILPKRNAVLRENLIRWGKPDIVITQNEPADFSELENYFDIAVIDAPCSGEGLFRKDKNAINEWSVKIAEMCAHRQRDILQGVIPAIKENGFLVYSTCTFEPSENEAQIEWLAQNGFKTVPLDIEAFPEIEKGLIENTFRFYPHKTSGSGFFICCLSKVGRSQIKVHSSSKRKRILPITEIKWDNAADWIERPANFTMLQTPYAIHAFPKDRTGDLFHLNRHLHITYFGIELGEMKKEIFTPSHALALSVIIKKDFSSIEVDKENALKYLRKTHPLIPSQEETLGWKTVKYKELNLGWVKVLRDRINNYLPNNWRILH